MKKGLLILMLAILTGVVTFTYVRSRPQVPRDHPAATLLEELPELAWLRKDLKLTDAQFEKVSELHVAYRPKCEEMCEQIARAHQRMDVAAQDSTGLTPELEAALADHAETQAACQKSMLDHLYRTAAVLDEDQARRYLETMVPYALGSTHHESRGARRH